MWCPIDRFYSVTTVIIEYNNISVILVSEDQRKEWETIVTKCLYICCFGLVVQTRLGKPQFRPTGWYLLGVQVPGSDTLRMLVLSKKKKE